MREKDAARAIVKCTHLRQNDVRLAVQVGIAQRFANGGGIIADDDRKGSVVEAEYGTGVVFAETMDGAMNMPVVDCQ